MKTGMTIVSGCPRSGTSLCMDIQRVVHGDEKILGNKFPQEKRNKLKEQQKNEPDHLYKIRSYIQQKQAKIIDDGTKDMNPEGFWEMAFTVQGVIYRPQFRQILQEVLDGKKYICKVVSQGLWASDPQYIGRIIYMVRHPRAVAKSQERLKRMFENPRLNGEEQKFHSPEMYIQVTAQAARFFQMFPKIPTLFLHYEDLLKNPQQQLERMQEFAGGDYSKAKDVVQQKLNRSKHEEIDCSLWEDAEKVYDLFCKEEYQKIIDYIEDPKCQINREKRSWPCYRGKQTVNENICKSCLNDSNTRNNMKKYSETSEGNIAKHWSEEPCLFECGMNVDREDYLTIDESIAKNFWNDDIQETITLSA
jgi:sulfotransferase family protein